MKMTKEAILEGDWRAGMKGLLNLELEHWWKTKRWWLQSLIWILLIDGFLVLALAVSKSGLPAAEQLVVDLPQLMSLFVGVVGLFVPLGVIILMHGAIISERQSGVTSWILSKPVSRSAYVFSKFIGNALGMLFSIVFLPGLIAYSILSWGFAGSWLSFSFLAALGLVALEVLFYIAFMLMIGTLFKQQIPALAMGIGFFLSQQFIIFVIPSLANLLPTGLSGMLFTPFALSQQLLSAFPVLINVFWVLLLMSVAVWRFEREEF